MFDGLLQIRSADARSGSGPRSAGCVGRRARWRSSSRGGRGSSRGDRSSSRGIGRSPPGLSLFLMRTIAAPVVEMIAGPTVVFAIVAPAFVAPPPPVMAPMMFVAVVVAVAVLVASGRRRRGDDRRRRHDLNRRRRGLRLLELLDDRRIDRRRAELRRGVLRPAFADAVVFGIVVRRQDARPAMLAEPAGQLAVRPVDVLLVGADRLGRRLAGARGLHHVARTIEVHGISPQLAAPRQRVLIERWP